MANRNLYLLIKFGKYKFMKQFFETGSIYMQRLRAFKDIEHDQIGDKNEGLSHSLQADRVVAKYNGIPLSLVGPIRIVSDVAYDPLIFCAYGFTNECIKEDGLHIDHRCYEFGEYAVVITDVEKFYQMIVDAVKKIGNGTVEGRLVEYVSYQEYHGEMGPFRKYDGFSHQSEFRLIYESMEAASTYTLEIGSLEHVATLSPSDQINSSITVDA